MNRHLIRMDYRWIEFFTRLLMISNLNIHRTIKCFWSMHFLFDPSMLSRIIINLGYIHLSDFILNLLFILFVCFATFFEVKFRKKHPIRWKVIKLTAENIAQDIIVKIFLSLCLFFSLFLHILWAITNSRIESD